MLLSPMFRTPLIILYLPSFPFPLFFLMGFSLVVYDAFFPTGFFMHITRASPDNSFSLYYLYITYSGRAFSPQLVLSSFLSTIRSEQNEIRSSETTPGSHRGFHTNRIQYISFLTSWTSTVTCEGWVVFFACIKPREFNIEQKGPSVPYRRILRR